MNNDQWDNLQSETAAWASKNFGANPPWQPMMGLVEEVGEFMSVDERPTLISNASYLRAERIDALGDQAIYVLNLCEKVGMNFSGTISGDPPADLTDRELVGALALGCHAVLKNSQGIRGMTVERMRDQLRIALGLWFGWAQEQTRDYGLPDMLTITKGVWEQVRKRNWVQDPEHAGTTRNVAQ